MGGCRQWLVQVYPSPLLDAVGGRLGPLPLLRSRLRARATCPGALPSHGRYAPERAGAPAAARPAACLKTLAAAGGADGAGSTCWSLACPRMMRCPPPLCCRTPVDPHSHLLQCLQHTPALRSIVQGGAELAHRAQCTQPTPEPKGHSHPAASASAWPRSERSWRGAAGPASGADCVCRALGRVPVLEIDHSYFSSTRRWASQKARVQAKSIQPRRTTSDGPAAQRDAARLTLQWAARVFGGPRAARPRRLPSGAGLEQ